MVPRSYALSLGIAAIILCATLQYVPLTAPGMKRTSLVSTLPAREYNPETRGIMMRAIHAARAQGELVHAAQDEAPFLRVVTSSSMLCAEGETSCEHPCDAFFTVTGQATNCTCKCTVNPASYIKGDVICKCPESPISPENDMYPSEEAHSAPILSLYGRDAELQRYMHAMRQQQQEKLAEEERARLLLSSLVAPRHGAPRTQFWIGAPEKMLPPNGDYPGGATGIPEDGYLEFDTGHGMGPYHGGAAMHTVGLYDQPAQVPVYGVFEA